MLDKCAVEPGIEQFASGAVMQQFVAADVVGVYVRVDDSRERPALFFQNFQNFFAGVFVVSAVDQTDFVPGEVIKPHSGGTVDIISAFAGLFEFVHFLLLALFVIRLSHGLHGCRLCAYQYVFHQKSSVQYAAKAVRADIMAGRPVIGPPGYVHIFIISLWILVFNIFAAF